MTVLKEPARAQVDAVVALLRATLADGLRSVLLTGSGASSGLRPDSDLDVVAVASRSLSEQERRKLLAGLLEISGWSGHPQRVAGQPLRPVECTVLTVEDLRAVSDWRDFQYGEWLRPAFAAGAVPRRMRDPDTVIVVAGALESALVLHGSPLSAFTAPITLAARRAAVARALPTLVAGLRGDERNVLLTLARMIVTARDGRILAKDDAARLVVSGLDADDAAVVRAAAAAYRGERTDDWSDPAPARRVAAKLEAMLARELTDDARGTEETP